MTTKKKAPPLAVVKFKAKQIWIDKTTAKADAKRTIMLEREHTYGNGVWHARSEWSDGRHGGRAVLIRESNLRRNFTLKP